jgi:hypothetical protein
LLEGEEESGSEHFMELLQELNIKNVDLAFVLDGACGDY